MKRKYTLEEFDEFIHLAYSSVPQICLGTDIIVGFPGETEELFQQTYEYLKNSPIHYFHVFSYSNRTLAQSRGLIHQAPSSLEIQKRSAILRNLSQRKRRLFYESLLGTRQKVIFEQKKDEFWPGLTDHYARVKVKSEKPLSKQMLDIQLEKIEGQTVIGSVGAISRVVPTKK